MFLLAHRCDVWSECVSVSIDVVCRAGPCNRWLARGALMALRELRRWPKFLLKSCIFLHFHFTIIVDVRNCSCDEPQNLCTEILFKLSALFLYKNWLKLPMAPAISLVG